MLFPYRNDLRKILVPYLESLEEENWYKRSDVYPNNLAWIIIHIAQSEDFWVSEVGLQQPLILHSESREVKTPREMINDYLKVRQHTDQVLSTMSTEDLDTIIQVPSFSDGWTPPSTPTMRWLFQHVFTHEAYHVGQIGVIARINGYPQPLF